ncbi:hypothetical protein [Jatrophihabitans sp.]|uniref:hypothetical protein n=1 Tax=Jatrophihabitans sp. TaxID=1932789 RepID=UPI0030C6B423|nr:hypothetical protein [Jatrophihabitans sp.]
MPEKAPEADEFGRYRVLDKDTDTKRSVVASQLPHGNHKVLDEPASDVAGDALPPEYPAPKPLSSNTPSGQSADLKKEISND